MKINPAEIDLVLLSGFIQIDHFCCADKEGSAPLQNFLVQHALDNQKKKLSTTWVIVKNGDPRVPIGYFSLACASIDVNDLDDVDLKGCPKFERFPGIVDWETRG